MQPRSALPPDHSDAGMGSASPPARAKDLAAYEQGFPPSRLGAGFYLSSSRILAEEVPAPSSDPALPAPHPRPPQGSLFFPPLPQLWPGCRDTCCLQPKGQHSPWHRAGLGGMPPPSTPKIAACTSVSSLSGIKITRAPPSAPCSPRFPSLGGDPALLAAVRPGGVQLCKGLGSRASRPRKPP